MLAFRCEWDAAPGNADAIGDDGMVALTTRITAYQ